MNDRQMWAARTAVDIVEGRNTSRKDAIRAACILCSGETYESLEHCRGNTISKIIPDAPPCPLFPFRLGGGRTLNLSEDQRKKIRSRFKDRVTSKRD